MAIATTLPSRYVTLRVPRSEVDESYQLLELPAEIIKKIEGQAEPLHFTIKGRPSDDAVICTPEKTYLLRSVSISNSLLICRQPRSQKTETADLEIRDTCHEILEVVPQPPNLDRIRTILKSTAWNGIGHGLPGRTGGRKRKWEEVGGRRYTRDQMKSVIQASDAELVDGLKERNVVEIDGRLQMFPAKSLGSFLSIILNFLTIHGMDSDQRTCRAPARKIIHALEQDHSVSPEISSAVMRLFSAENASRIVMDEGSDADVVWDADVKGMVREIGRGLLENLDGQKPRDSFEEEWRENVGEWEDLIDLEALKGNYLLTPPPASAFNSSTPLVSYFPLHNLPLVPAIRFSDLFLTRTPWRPDDMIPFLKGLYRGGDTKERDKLVVKFVRVVKEKDGGIWWHPRRSS